MRKIALLFYRTVSQWDSSDDYYRDLMLARSITDWSLVSEEDYKNLIAHSGQFGYQVIETPKDMVTDVLNTVEQVKVEIAKKAELDRVAKEARDARAAKKKADKQAKERAALLAQAESRRKLYEELSKEFLSQ